jgi:NAD(P)-dependent dehydrogenase (short-subunit alcohol dehydrogenase family)
MLIIGLIVLLVVFPVVVILLKGVLDEANAIVPAVTRIRDAARAGSNDLDAVPLLLTTQEQVRQTVENVAAYGGSLDVILDDAEPGNRQRATGGPVSGIPEVPR